MREEEALTGHDYETMKFCVNAYLRYIRCVENTLTVIAEDIERLEARLELLGVSFEPSGLVSPGGDKFPEGIAKATELRDEWSGAMARHADELAEARRLCRPINENRYVLWLHFVERQTWDSAARYVGYSVRQIKRMAVIGTSELYELMPERWRCEPIPNAAPQ